MASQLIGSPSAAPTTVVGRVVDLCVRRRVPISIVLFGGLIALDLFVFGSRPRDLLDWTSPVTAAGSLLVFAGLLVRTWAAGTLRKQRELATTGAYAFVRHPLYF